jgi:hypothetical protein
MLPNAQRERENIKLLDSPQCPERERHREREVKMQKKKVQRRKDAGVGVQTKGT